MSIGVRRSVLSTPAIALAFAAALVAAPAASAEDGFGANADVTRSDETGKVIFVGTDPGQPLPAPAGIGAGDPAATAALAYLDQHAQALGIAGDELNVLEASDTAAGTAVHTQQLVNGVPVLAGELIVNLTDANEILSVSGEALPVGSIDTEPALSDDEAKGAAIAAVARDTGVAEDALKADNQGLNVYDPSLFGEDGGSVLSSRIQVYSPEDAAIVKEVLVDANSGEVVRINEQVHSALNREVCDNNNNRTATQDCTAPVRTEGNVCNPACFADVDSSYNFSGDTYNFYNARWTRDSLDGAGMQLTSTVRFCTNTTDPNPSPPPPTVFRDPCPYNNAFFSSFTPATASQAFYGQGWASDDIVAHELTHGVTNFESNLVYQNESGALNESLSDVFGEAVDLVNGAGTDTAATRWQIGEDCTVTCNVLRDMEAPGPFGDPDKMTSPNWKFWTADNGGVHSNSGVSNKAMFLLTDGQTFNTYTVSPIGLEKAVRIFYEAQVDILTTGSDYGAMANALRQACTNLTGTNGIVAADCTQVQNAVLATEMDTEALAPDTNINSGPGNTDDPTPTWTFSSPSQNFQANGNPEKPGLAGATYQCSVDQGTPNFVPCSGPGNSHTPSSDLADGNYTFRVRGSIGSNTDPTPATRDFTVSTADMELVSKADSQDPAFAGETLTYTIRARNNGPGTAENARVVDVLPNGVTYQSSSIPCTESPTGTLTCGLGNLTDDQEVTFTITVSIARDLVHNNGSPLTITNTATADSDRNDRDASNDQKTANTLVKAKADLEIVSFAADSPPVEMIVGQPADVTLKKVITNNGPSAPMDVRVARGAAATSNATVSPTATSHVESAVGFEELRQVDEKFTIECTGGGPATFTFTNAIAPDRVDDTDPDTSNNSAMTSFEVECIVPVAINIHPGSFTNPIELSKKSGEIPVAVLTTEAGEYGLPLAFDATQIRPLTARFGPKAVVTAGGGAPETHRRGHIEDAIERSDEVTLDGDLDMLLHFNAQKSQLTGSETEACVRGRYGAANTVFQGCDSVSFVP